VCPNLKKALEDWKRRKEQIASLKGQNIQSETNLSYEMIPIGRTRKYGYSLVPKFSSGTSSEGVQAPKSMEKEYSIQGEKALVTPQEAIPLENSGTATPTSFANEMTFNVRRKRIV
jgi:hypothetical protein